MEHTLPALSYSYDALEPHIDALTMEIHHSKHHQTYITNYTNLLKDTGLLEKYSPLQLLQYLEEVPADKKQGVINNLGGHINHSFFWTILSPNDGGKPTGTIVSAIDTTFGSFEAFQEAFTAKALSVFGSGWAWLCRDANNALIITSTPGQNSPLSEGLVPVLGLDVWEHAYYLKHQNKRAEYIKSFWNVINWAQIEANFTA
ncbi:superoxide dismutase [Candidatus Gracilibacteria bacterium]|nr:superoxide dismutase [Candidatus Gracilibacteria bacterium]